MARIKSGLCITLSAEHGHYRYSFGHLSFLTLQRGNAVGDAPRHRSAVQRAFRI
ncbi:DUF1534 domain-containing protein [Pseudomonas syringae]|uniref:DUF1534 domain-containing protein n=1 Tax=Pseudomonas syringae TaxID=317 RepID=A0A9Q4FI74_PSESX|nr:DUF1534 domain-containing protein [Pseudomonas syringae]MCF5472760.1 DUF1534 domain-containing protein [Pseudomonas syringae]MCF5481384.1 DUF1534 domain-containing protein [Pseudomonas syringae]MCF5486803.1 DUF1534 domain-containing protein [Pseudomonas syringae]MCF5492699.1 DUF1534 domain-containing protein [Pseudomonas syringae]